MTAAASLAIAFLTLIALGSIVAFYLVRKSQRRAIAYRQALRHRKGQLIKQALHNAETKENFGARHATSVSGNTQKESQFITSIEHAVASATLILTEGVLKSVRKNVHAPASSKMPKKMR